MWVTSFKSVTSVFWLESNIGSFYISDIKKLGWFLQLNSTYIIFIVYYISLKTLKMHYYNTGKGLRGWDHSLSHRVVWKMKATKYFYHDTCFFKWCFCYIGEKRFWSIYFWIKVLTSCIVLLELRWRRIYFKS